MADTLRPLTLNLVRPRSLHHGTAARQPSVAAEAKLLKEIGDARRRRPQVAPRPAHRAHHAAEPRARETIAINEVPEVRYQLWLIAGRYDVLHDWIDLVLPPLAAEYAIMADTGLHVVALQIRAQFAAEIVRSNGLADGADVVTLALHCKQHGAADCIGVDRGAVPFELAAGQGMHGTIAQAF